MLSVVTGKIGVLGEDSQVLSEKGTFLGPLTQTRFQSRRSKSPGGQRACPGTGRESVLRPALAPEGQNLWERSGALGLGGGLWTRLGRPHLSVFEMKTFATLLASRLTRCAVTSWLLKARAQQKRRPGTGLSHW